MSKRGERSAEKAEFWKLVVAEWQESEISVREFCKNNGLSEPSFYSWRRELKKREKEASGKAMQGAGKQPIRNSAKPPIFIPLSLKAETERQPEAKPDIEVIVGQHSIRIQPGFDSETLGRVLAVIAKASA
jgi:transposase-like protein